MDKETHKKADRLLDEMKDVQQRIDYFDIIKNLPPGQIEKKSVSIGSLGVGINITGKTLNKISYQITCDLKQELEELKKQYKEL